MDDISSTDRAPAPPLRHRAGLLLALALCTIVGPACSSDPGDGTAPVPTATLIDLSTEAPADWDADGRPLVINLWASWCAPCRKEMPAFDKVAERLGDEVAIVGVTDETDLDAARSAAADTGVRYPLLVDVDQTLLVDLDVSGLPGTVFIDDKGQIVGRHLGALTEDELLTEIEERFGITV